MKKKQSMIFVIIIFLAGLSLLLYPLVANEWNNYRQKRLISNYEEAVTQAEESIDYEAEWKKAHDYNEALLPSILPDSFAVAAASEEEDEVYMSCLNLAGNGVMGYVEIPKIDIKLPVFHGTDEKVLEQAAGHLEGSSLPVGGVNTHAVISAHRGLPSASLFTDLDRLEEGDHFLLYILDDILCYEVDRVSVVEPEETEGLSVVDGEDLVTLLTCTPYGVNSHRLLVRGHRVDYVPEAVKEEKAGLFGAASIHTNYLLWVIIGLGVTAVFIAALYLHDRKIRKAQAQNRENQED
ncbi:class C sortase [Frisingicoccus sp.]|uniref:class C sortase n=1 Tax=Frisingicoccus sp. TaxID=1918627 RepID=UPI003AB1F7FE